MRNKKAFTLVELMVAMAIVAVLIGLSVFGISTAQRVLRDNQRRDAVKNIAAGLNAYYAQNAEYPTDITVSNNGTIVNISGTLDVPLNGIAKTREQNDGQSTAADTTYCYALTSTGYKLGSKLEDGSWFNLGTASPTDPEGLCDDNSGADFLN